MNNSQQAAGVSELGAVAAMSLVMILLMLPLMIGYWRIGNRAADMLTGMKR